MNTNVFIERLKTKAEQMRKEIGESHTKREAVYDLMYVVFVMDDGHEIRVANKDDHIEISTATGVLNVRPDGGNGIKVGAVMLGSPVRGTSDASL